MTGRRQLRNNLHVIEDGLRRMQEEIERRQRENSISYGENLEELAEELQKINEEETVNNFVVLFVRSAQWILLTSCQLCVPFKYFFDKKKTQAVRLDATKL
jgi:hypothetical protein